MIVTLRGEPPERVGRLYASLVGQVGCRGLEVVLAVPREEVASLRWLGPEGSVGAVETVENPSGLRSDGLNAAARAAAAPIVCRADARSALPPGYVARCVDVLRRDPSVGVVGGVQRPQTVAATARARGIARALGNPWAMGGAHYRRGGRSGPADTVYLGAFRRAELLELGGYDERLHANEDFDLCQRYRKAGKVVWVEGDLVVAYEARDSFADVARQYYEFGRSKVRYWRVKGGHPNARQVAGLGVTSSTLAALAWSTMVRRHSPLPVAVGALGATAAVDLVGAGRPLSFAVGASSYATYACTTGGWFVGVIAETLRPRFVAPKRGPA